MNRHPTDLKLVYALSWQRVGKKDAPVRSLADPTEWLLLKRHINEYMAGEQSKKSKSGHIKAPTVTISPKEGTCGEDKVQVRRV